MDIYFLGPGVLSQLAVGDGDNCKRISNWLETASDNDEIVIRIVSGTYCYLLDALTKAMREEHEYKNRTGYQMMKSNLLDDFEDFDREGWIIGFDANVERSTIQKFPLDAVIRTGIGESEAFWDASFRHTAAAAAKISENSGSSTVVIDCTDAEPLFREYGSRYGIEFMNASDL